MTAANIRVQKYRETLRQAGLRPVQLWVPDTRGPDFAQECARQSLLIKKSEQAKAEEANVWLDHVAEDIPGWTA